jgi:anthranilate synthase component 1
MLRAMTKDEFERWLATGLKVPVYREILADLETPVTAFLKLSRDASTAFLLESVTGGEQVGRYSFLGADPDFVLTIEGERVRRAERGGVLAEQSVERGRLVDVPRRALAPYRAAAVPGLPPLVGGAVGFFGYEAARWIERLPEGRGPAASAEMALGYYSEVVAFDHARRRMILIALADRFDQAQERLDRLQDRLAQMLPRLEPPAGPHPLEGFEADLTAEQFRAGVRQIQEHILAGDAYQVVLSRRLRCPRRVDPFRVYRTLASINPSPYTFFLRFGELALAGSSPEPLVKLRGREVEIRPIAGTRRRGADQQEDLRLEAELLADPKEAAEHLMLVDLGRNDVGRCAVAGTVRLASFRAVERYSHVMHLVSAVRGELAPDKDALDALLAGFPAGTVSGAPKVRAMEILAQLEGSRRGIYSGAVGYLGADGALDTCIAIRTLVFDPGGIELRVGAGVVADSDPERELAETDAKAAAMLAALSAA